MGQGPAMPNVELVYFEGCPNAAEARSRLQQALESCRLAPVWREWDLGAGDAPSHVMGYASPTVLVDGRDVAGDGERGSGPGCAAAGPPTVEAIVAVLRGAGS